MIVARIGLRFAVGVILLVGCANNRPAEVVSADPDSSPSFSGQVEQIKEPLSLPTGDLLEPAPADLVPTADLSQVIKDARALPEDLATSEPRILLGMYAPPSRTVGKEELEAIRLSYVVLFDDILSRPIGPPVLPGEKVVEAPLTAPAVVVAIFDATTGEQLRATTVGCGLTDTCR